MPVEACSVKPPFRSVGVPPASPITSRPRAAPRGGGEAAPGRLLAPGGVEARAAPTRRTGDRLAADPVRDPFQAGAFPGALRRGGKLCHLVLLAVIPGGDRH